MIFHQPFQQIDLLLLQAMAYCKVFNINGAQLGVIAATVEKPISLSVNASFSADKSLSFTGSYTLNMKDYAIEPPSAMFGQIVSGEKVTISFNVQVK